jgi:hypothetical protein
VTVACVSDLGPGIFGVAEFGTGRIDLVGYFCGWLNAFARLRHPASDYHARRNPPGFTTARYEGTEDALVISLHEAEHLRHPAWTEACVQRAALVHLKFYAMRLGADRTLAQKIVRYGWKLTREWMPDDYWPGICLQSP